MSHIFVVDATHKLNVMVDGTRVSETEFPSYVELMDAAREIRDNVAKANPNGFVVAQYQIMGVNGWYHGAILS